MILTLTKQGKETAYDKRYCFFSERGAREVNQDAIYVSADKDRGIFVVADGMGGHTGGEIASAAIANGIRNWWDSSQFLNVDTGIELVAGQCNRLLRNVNTEVFTCFSEKKRTGGSTAAVLIIWDNRYEILSAGDSRIYRVREKMLEQLTTDDVWENLPDVKYTTSNEAMTGDAQFGKLTEAIGSDKRIRMRRESGMLSGSEVFLLCSDGVYQYCTYEELRKILCTNKRLKTADKIKEKIRKCVLKNGVDDNYSAVICKIKSG